MRRFFGAIASLIVVLVVFSLINVILVGGQKLWHRKDEVKLQEIKDRLDSEQTQICRMEADLTQMATRFDVLESEISALKPKIETIEADHPKGIPSGLFTEYSRMIDRHNFFVTDHNNLLAQQDVLYANYSNRVDGYNALVEEANVLAKEVGTTWYVIPVPRMSGQRNSRPNRR